MDLETRRVLEAKMLKLINFLRNIVSNIEIQGCHEIGEKDEKLEYLHFGGGSGWGPKTSAVDMTPCLPKGRGPLKKCLPPSPCGRPLTAPHRAPRGTPRTDPLTMYQSVGCEPELNS